MTALSVDTSPHREVILAVQRAALEAVDPAAAVRHHVDRRGSQLVVGTHAYDLDALEHVWVIGAGKAAAGMAGALNRLLSDRLDGGLVITKYGHTPAGADTGPVEVVEAGHPVPDPQGVDATRRLVELVARAGPRDLVLGVISGGGSALMVLPAPGLTLDELQRATGLLLRAGATIVELNAVRKHLSQIKGGGLARLAGPAQIAALVLSDVVGDPLDTIASGPLSPDRTTFADAWATVERYNLVESLPEAVRHRLRAGVAGEVEDTPKPGAPLFDRVHVTIVGSNRLAATAAAESAREHGLNSLLLSTFVEGEAREVGHVAAALAKELVRYDRPVSRPACLIWGGETTVTVQGGGTGGRNQELALAAAVAMEGLPGVILVALATDGTDGPTDAAGAVATGETVSRARAAGLDPAAHLADNNAYPFFNALGDLIRTGPTGTNVNDLLFLFAFPPAGAATNSEAQSNNLPTGGTMRKILITAGDVVETAILHDNPTADAIWEALPFAGPGSRWGDEIYFEIPVELPAAEDARDVLEPGELGYWPDGNAFCIFWGPTPVSRSDEPRAYTPVNVFGRLEGDPQKFDQVPVNAQVHVNRS